MNIETYLRQKYAGTSPGLTRAEALVLGIPYPLKSGWLARHGPHRITPEQEQMLRRMTLERRSLKRAQSNRNVSNQLDLFSDADIGDVPTVLNANENEQ